MKYLLIPTFLLFFISYGHSETKNKKTSSNSVYPSILSVEGLRYSIPFGIGVDSFQRQYGSSGLLSATKNYGNPIDKNMIITAGYLKEILDRFENEIQELREETHKQYLEIQRLSVDIDLLNRRRSY